MELVGRDWRDTLMFSGLEHADHEEELDRLLGPKPSPRGRSLLDVGSPIPDVGRAFVLDDREERPVRVPPTTNVEAMDEWVLSNFLGHDGRIRTIPTKLSKLLVVLDHLAQEFEPGQTYPEAKVNEVL